MTILDSVTMKPVEPPQSVEDGIPFITHEGTLGVGGFEFHVYQLSDGQRVIPCEEVEQFFAGVAPSEGTQERTK